MRSLALLLALIPTVRAATDDTLEDRFKLLGQMTKFGLYGLGLVLLAMSPLRPQKRGSLSSFYLLWWFVQCYRWLPSISLSYPPYFIEFYTYLAQTLCLLQLDTPKGEDISQRSFTHYCAKHNLFVVNGADMLLVLLVAMGILITAVVVGADAEEGFRQSFKEQAKYSSILRGLSLTTLDLMIYAILQLQYADWSDNFQRFSTVLAVMYLSVMAVYTVSLPLMIVMNREKVSQGDPPTYCSTLTDEFRPNLPHISYHYESLLHLQRLSIAFTLALGYDSPTTQLVILISLEGAMVAWVFCARPYEKTALWMCSLGVHLLLAGMAGIQFLIQAEVADELTLTLASTFALWAGIGLCAIRYFANFKLPTASPVSHSEPTNDTITDNNSILTSTPSGKSQLPNAPYHSRIPRVAFI